MTYTMPLTAVREYLKAYPAVAALVGEHVYAGQLPKAFTASWRPDQAEPCVLVEQDGGSGDGLSAASWAHVGGRLVRVRCLGPTNARAEALDQAVREAMRTMVRLQADNGTVLYHARMVAGPNASLREPQTDWIYVLSGYQLTTAETRAA